MASCAALSLNSTSCRISPLNLQRIDFITNARSSIQTKKIWQYVHFHKVAKQVNLKGSFLPGGRQKGVLCPAVITGQASTAQKRSVQVTCMDSKLAGTKEDQKSSTLVLCFGEMLIDFVPTVSGVSLAEAPAFEKAPGGAPANVAVGISRLGGNAAFMGKVGEDEFGRMLADILASNGVDVSSVLFDGGARTALAFVTLRADGEREFMFYRNPSADMLLTPTELDYSLIQQAGVVHYGSISLISEPSKSAHLAFLEAAQKGGALLSYDPNLRLPLWSSAAVAKQEILSIWEKADIIKVSEDEISFLTEGLDPYSDAAALSLFHDNLKLLLVTEGNQGARYYTKTFNGREDGYKVKTVDTTGAGDAFVAGFLTQLSQDQSVLLDETKLRRAIRFANACGAIATEGRGAIPSLPSEERALALVASVGETQKEEASAINSS